MQLREAERQIIAFALEATEHNLLAAADLLEIPKALLARRAKLLGLRVPRAHHYPKRRRSRLAKMPEADRILINASSLSRGPSPLADMPSPLPDIPKTTK